MILHNSSQQPYRDKLGKRRLFKDSIDHLGREIHGSGWIGPFSSYEPRIIPAARVSLDDPDVDYAIDIISAFNATTDMKCVEPEWNDSIPSLYNRPYIHISPDDWMFAHRKATDIHNEQVLIREQTHDLLERFSRMALSGEITCYAQNRTTLRIKPIRPQDWNVGQEVLWSRYVSETIDIASPAIPTYNGQYIISVHEETLRCITFSGAITEDERLADTKKRLIEAASLYPDVAPHEGLKTLIRDVAGYIRLSNDSARDLIMSIPGHNWNYKCRKKKSANRPGNDFRVTPKSTL